jgi:hypothetical protein
MRSCRLRQRVKEPIEQRVRRMHRLRSRIHQQFCRSVALHEIFRALFRRWTTSRFR